MDNTVLLHAVPSDDLSAGSSDIVGAPSPVESDDHLGLALTPVSSLFVSLIPAGAHRRPVRARATYRAVA